MNELLPLGSLVLLENDDQKLMIYGRKQIQKNTQQEWDYVACLYPYGFINDEYNFFFNHESISKVIFKGLEDSDEVNFRKAITEI